MTEKPKPLLNGIAKEELVTFISSLREEAYREAEAEKKLTDLLFAKVFLVKKQSKPKV